jgi:predicted amidohydrolase YtcJ
VNGRIYTLTWAEPDGFGNPAGEAPRGINGWHPDAEAIAINGNRIALVGDRSAVEQRQGAATRVIDLQGATVLLVSSIRTCISRISVRHWSG